eukprot:6173110-Pleurochrysis_carterae.AAC.2
MVYLDVSAASFAIRAACFRSALARRRAHIAGAFAKCGGAPCAVSTRAHSLVLNYISARTCSHRVVFSGLITSIPQWTICSLYLPTFLSTLLLTSYASLLRKPASIRCIHL